MTPPMAGAAVDPCLSYDQDVREDLRLLALDPVSVVAARTPSAVPRHRTGSPVTLTLAPQSSMQWLQAPERPMIDDGSYAGLLALDVTAPGRYRVSMSAHAWVDLLDADGNAIVSTDFAGRSECKPLTKLVEFTLEQPGVHTLQVSGSTEPQVRVVMRPLPAVAR